MPKLIFKEANSTAELQQIHELNHRVFAEEVAQHATHPSGMLVDRFHQRNRYFVALEDDVVVGMISAHAGPDFSITRRLPDPEVLRLLPRPMEIRLLAIEPQARHRTVLAGLLWQVYDYAYGNGCSHLLISGIVEREAMYRKMGFLPLGPPVAEGSAQFIPMMMSIAEQRQRLQRRVRMHQRGWQRRTEGENHVSLLPGPANIHSLVAQSFAQPPVSHRAPSFAGCFEEMRAYLNALAGGMRTAVFPGGGTLANDAVAANLRALFGEAEGLILSNGEFGDRLTKQAARVGLRFAQLQFGWGNGWEENRLADAMKTKPAWVWAIHLETSTGVLNDVTSLLRMAGTAGAAVALDCVSSLGAVATPGEGTPLFFSSSVSGKSLGAYAGLGMVHLSAECMRRLETKSVCTSFDVLHMAKTSGPVATIPSPSVMALLSALRLEYSSADRMRHRFAEYATLGEAVRRVLRAAGMKPLASEEYAAPNVTTFALPDAEFVRVCSEHGFVIAHESPYLLARQWGQIATMGDVTLHSLDRFSQFVTRRQREMVLRME